MGQLDLLRLLFPAGDRVEIAPHLDRHVRGDRFGVVEKVGRFYLHVRMDHSGDLFPVVPENVRKVEVA